MIALYLNEKNSKKRYFNCVKRNISIKSNSIRNLNAIFFSYKNICTLEDNYK